MLINLEAFVSGSDLRVIRGRWTGVQAEDGRRSRELDWSYRLISWMFP